MKRARPLVLKPASAIRSGSFGQQNLVTQQQQSLAQQQRNFHDVGSHLARIPPPNHLVPQANGRSSSTSAPSSDRGPLVSNTADQSSTIYPGVARAAAVYSVLNHSGSLGSDSNLKERVSANANVSSIVGASSNNSNSAVDDEKDRMIAELKAQLAITNRKVHELDEELFSAKSELSCIAAEERHGKSSLIQSLESSIKFKQRELEESDRALAEANKSLNSERKLLREAKTQAIKLERQNIELQKQERQRRQLKSKQPSCPPSQQSQQPPSQTPQDFSAMRENARQSSPALHKGNSTVPVLDCRERPVGLPHWIPPDALVSLIHIVHTTSAVTITEGNLEHVLISEIASRVRFLSSPAEWNEHLGSLDNNKDCLCFEVASDLEVLLRVLRCCLRDHPDVSFDHVIATKMLVPLLECLVNGPKRQQQGNYTGELVTNSVKKRRKHATKDTEGTSNSTATGTIHVQLSALTRAVVFPALLNILIDLARKTPAACATGKRVYICLLQYLGLRILNQGESDKDIALPRKPVASQFSQQQQQQQQKEYEEPKQDQEQRKQNQQLEQKRIAPTSPVHIRRFLAGTNDTYMSPSSLASPLRFASKTAANAEAIVAAASATSASKRGRATWCQTAACPTAELELLALLCATQISEAADIFNLTSLFRQGDQGYLAEQHAVWNRAALHVCLSLHVAKPSLLRAPAPPFRDKLIDILQEIESRFPEAAALVEDL